MKTFRTFIAVDVSDSVGASAERMARRLRRLDLGVKWVPRQQLHLTLVFVGDLPEVQVPDVCRATRAAAGQFGPFVLEFCALGVFPNPRRPRVIWMGTAGGSPELVRLQAALARELDQREIEFDRRSFHPHLTLGRLRQVRSDTSELAAAIQRETDNHFGSSPVEQLVVYCSDLNRAGAIHTPLATARLGV